MNAIKKSHTGLYVLVLALFTFGFASCSSDDDDEKRTGIETEMGLFGTYKGFCEVIAPVSNSNEDIKDEAITDLKLAVAKEHTMVMDTYPIKGLIYELYTTPEEAESAFTEIKKINPRITFESKKIDQKAGLISLDIDVKDVTVRLKNGDTIEFNLDDVDHSGKFDNKKGYKLGFVIAVNAKLYLKKADGKTDVKPAKTVIKKHQFSFEKATK